MLPIGSIDHQQNRKTPMVPIANCFVAKKLKEISDYSFEVSNSSDIDILLVSENLAKKPF